MPGAFTIISSLSLLLLLSSSIFFLPTASAHPYIEETLPSTAQNAPAGTTEVVVHFSESVDIEFSEIRVLDDKGERVDNRDMDYYNGELSLIVTTQPLEDGVYTVSTKVLSKVDGHLVPGVFLFGVGDVVIDPELLSREKNTEILFIPEAAAEFPGIVGQTIILGALVAILAVWRTVNRRSLGDEAGVVEEFHRKKVIQLIGAGLLLLLASNLAVIMLQMSRLESTLAEAVLTQFGMVWLAKMATIITMFVIWFGMNAAKNSTSTRIMQFAMLGATLVLMMTSSISGHGAATETVEVVVLDYIHNIVAGVWIGGIIYALFVLFSSLSKCSSENRERTSLSVIPRLSMIFIISVGVVIVTGPTLLWTLESDVGLITESLFGRLIILKVAIASAMVGSGMFIQRILQRRAEVELRRSEKINIHAKIRRVLGMDMAMGIALLVVVALLTNGTLPAGEIQRSSAVEEISTFSITEFSGNVRFDVDITPFATGENLILVTVSGTGNGSGSRPADLLDDFSGVKVKTSNPSRNIPPIEVAMNPIHGGDPSSFSATQSIDEDDDDKNVNRFWGKLTLGFSGDWLIEIEAQRKQHANEAVLLDIFAKPRLAEIRTQVTEYLLPNDTRPLHAVYDDKLSSIWISDTSKARLWEFATEDAQQFTPHYFEGNGTTFLTYNQHDGNVWFTDMVGSRIGFVDTQSNTITTIDVPELITEGDQLPTDKPAPFFIESDSDGNVWFTVINRGMIVKYQPQTDMFESVVVPGDNPRPFALEAGPDGMIWYTATGTGTVGHVDPKDGSLTEVITEPLESPEALLFDPGKVGDARTLWITEHTGHAVVEFDPILGTLERYEVPDNKSLPFGMEIDRYGNVWFAQHTIDKMGVLDPHNEEIIEIDIPTQTSFVQFLVSDGDGNVWFAEQRANRVGMLSITEGPSTYQVPVYDDNGKVVVGGGQDTASLQHLSDIRYADLVSPLMALGILSTSLFYVKAVHDKRRLDRLFFFVQ